MESDVNILVVDDSRPLRNFVVQAIADREGFTPLEASDGAEGLEMARSEMPDLMLLDLEMPRLNGIQVLDALNEEAVDIPVILMTSHGSETIAVEVFRRGVRDYLIKPFHADDMFTVIDRALTEIHLRREKEALTEHLAEANQSLKQRVVELNTLYHIGKSVTALLSRDQLLDRILEAAFQVTSAEEATLMLMDEETGTMHTERHRQRVPGQADFSAHRTAEELGAAAVRKGDMTDTGVMLSAPLKIGERIIGALGVSNRISSQPFSEHDRRLLLSLADYCAVALENTRLVRQVEETKEREKQIVRGMFERYVSPAVVERLLAQPDRVALGGTRQQVAILFADIRGFSAYSAQTDPEVLVNVLNRHLAVGAEAILAEEGTLDKFMGDGVMALFNTPLAQPDFAMRAVRAALRIQYAVSKAHKQLPPEHRLPFGIGISVGEAVVGNIGTSKMMSFTAIGDTVNLGRRLQENARGGQILLSQAAYQMVQQQVKARPLGELQIEGRDRPEPTFELLGLRNKE
jgi:class 3 adenylate cyclase/DNA-binding response OmpR family regulator